MAIINTTGVKAEEKNGITEAGVYVLKIEKIEVDGYDQESNEKFKLSLSGKKVIDGKMSQNTYTMFEWLEQREKMIWKIARLRDALKSPELFDLDDWVGRYFIATVEMHTYNGKTNPQIKRAEYSKLNDTLPPIPNRAQNAGEPAVMETQDDEMPF